MANRRGLTIVLVTVAIGAAVLAGALWDRDHGPTLAPDFAAPDLALQLGGQCVDVDLQAQ